MAKKDSLTLTGGDKTTAIGAALLLGGVAWYFLSKTPTTGDGVTALVTGRVGNDKGEEIAGVAVSLGSLQTATGSDGRYTFEDVMPGNYNITFTKAGYIPVSATITIVEGLNDIPTVQLMTDAPPALTIRLKNPLGDVWQVAVLLFDKSDYRILSYGSTAEAKIFTDIPASWPVPYATDVTCYNLNPNGSLRQVSHTQSWDSSHEDYNPGSVLPGLGSYYFDATSGLFEPA